MLAAHRVVFHDGLVRVSGPSLLKINGNEDWHDIGFWDTISFLFMAFSSKCSSKYPILPIQVTKSDWKHAPIAEDVNGKYVYSEFVSSDEWDDCKPAWKLGYADRSSRVEFSVTSANQVHAVFHAEHNPDFTLSGHIWIDDAKRFLQEPCLGFPGGVHLPLGAAELQLEFSFSDLFLDSVFDGLVRDTQ
jgi:hypothetical protein